MSAISHHRRLALASALLASAVAAGAQDAEPGRATVAAPTGVVAPLVPVAPPMHWSVERLRALLDAVDHAAAEGLRPADYGRDAIAAAIDARRSGPGVDAIAERAARTLAHDYAVGRVGDRTRFDWHIETSPAALVTLAGDVDRAVAAGRLRSYLAGLLPQDPRYAALRAALAKTPATDTERQAHLRASMERWRWMPRTLGSDYVMVNVPAYRLTLVRDDKVVATHDVVVGAPKTPTPMLASYANAVVVNPWWTLPPTVLAEGGRYPAARGFVRANIGGRSVVRQKPGPLNALGRVKIDMPNPYAIYLHDTPAKAGFAKANRALSHGCIRVKDIASLGEALAPDVADALASPATQTLQLERSVPVYIVYFTAAEQDGRVVTFGDPYARDASLVAALDAAPVAPVQLAYALP